MPAPAAPKEPDPSETRVAAVKQVLDTKLAQYGGTWSVPYIDLERGRDVTVNDEKLVAASLVKLYIMLAVFDGIEHDTITDDANVDALLKHLAQRQKESPDYYERLPELNGRTGWQQLDTTLCMRILLDPEKDAARPLDLLGSTPHPAAARRACNAVRMARNEAAHASDRTAAAQAAIRFNEAVEELEAGYEGTALTTGDLEKYYRMAEDFLSRCGASETIEPQKKAEDEAPRRQKSQKSGSTSRKRQSGGSRTTSKGTSGRSRNASGRNSRSRQNMQTTARRKKRQRTQSRALTVVLLAVVLLGLLVRAWTMGLMK